MTFATIARSAAMATLLLAGAAHAAPKRADMGSGWMSYHAGTDRYCLTSKQAPTGSRLPQVTCKSAADWKTDGLTVGVR